MKKKQIEKPKKELTVKTKKNIIRTKTIVNNLLSEVDYERKGFYGC